MIVSRTLACIISSLHAVIFFQTQGVQSFGWLPSKQTKSVSLMHNKVQSRLISLKVYGSNDSEQELTKDEISRYSRHLVLGDVGVAGQKAIKNSNVLVIGAGGLGSPCLLYLAAAGVGHIGIVDGDVVDESNLQRQVIHSTSTINMSKCKSAYKALSDLNPNIKISLFEEELTSESALRIFQSHKWDVVVDGSDNFPTKYLINDACDIVGIPWVYSAILAFEGQLSVFNYPVNVGPTYRDMMPEPPPPGDVPSCAEGGVLGVLPGTMGCLQATEVLKVILKKDVNGILSGRVMVYEALPMKFSEVGLKRLPDGERVEVKELIDYQGFCAGPKVESKSTPVERNHNNDDKKQGGRTMDEVEQVNMISSSSGSTFHSITPIECLEKLSSGWTPYVLDVRLQTENDIVALPFTDNVVPHRIVNVDNIPKEGDVLVYCKAGVRGKKACQRLIDLGILEDRLWNLDGGIMRWQKEVDTSMPRY